MKSRPLPFFIQQQVALQNKYTKALKAYKKGLMQLAFFLVEEVY